MPAQLKKFPLNTVKMSIGNDTSEIDPRLLNVWAATKQQVELYNSESSHNLKLSKLRSAQLWFKIDCQTPAASGSYVTLFNPTPPNQWSGNFRIATLLNLSLEPDLLAEELFPEVAWEWFSNPLIKVGVKRLNGTFSIVKDLAFVDAQISNSDGVTSAQIRASWSLGETSDSDLSELARNSFNAWLQALTKFTA
jgi:hypothetical protein